MNLPPTTPIEKATLRWLKEFSGQGILITDDRLIIRGWNLWLEIHSGKKADGLIGEHLFEAFPDLVQRRLDRLYQEVLAGQIKVLAHLFHKYLFCFPSSISATHTLFMLQSAHITPLTDDSGNIVGTLTAIVDVSERVSRENALTREKDLAQKYLDIAGVIMLVLDTEGRVQLINKKGCEILGLSGNEIIGKNWFENYVPESDRQDLLDNFLSAMAEKDLILDYVENPVVNASGKEKLIAWRNILLRNDAGKIIGSLSSGEDITERKLAEIGKARFEALNRQLQKAASLGRMAGAIAHNFNNQIQAVMGNLEMAMDDLPRGKNPIDALNESMQAARKAAEVGKLMLTYLGQTPGNHQPIDLSDACRQSLTLLQAAVPKDVILTADIPSSGPVIRANAGQIQQLLTNLVTNAWEAVGGKKGTVALTVKTVSQMNISATMRFPIDWQPIERNYVCLEVADAGCGITCEDIENLFDPFYSTKFTGRGMGLSIVLGIVKAHNGGITVVSELGQGSIFRVYFPLSAEEVRRQPDKPIQSPEIQAGGTVLLIEDEELVRKMTRTRLTHLGYRVIEAKDGIEALETFQQHQDEIRCVLSDLTMPRMDGWETLAALRKLSPDIPVILSSGYDEAQVMADEHPERPNAFLGKPHRLQDLKDTICHTLAEKKKTSPRHGPL